MKAREHSVGILLAGGKSSRMGGGDKCLLPLAGRPILAHVIERSRRPALLGERRRRAEPRRGPVGRRDAPGVRSWPVTLAPDLEASLISGERKVSDWVRQHQAREVMFPPLEIGSRTIDPFFNINRSDDLAAAEAFLQASAV